jgi:hypothetical protein
VGLGAAVAAFALGAPQASACDWWWGCSDRPYAERPAPRWYGYRSQWRGYGYGRPWRGYGYGGAAWAYGYTSPERFYGDPYAAWPSTSIPQREWYVRTAPPVPNANAVGLTTPVTSQQGLFEGGLPAKGPSLFGPNPPPPPATSWGYYYSASPNGYYYTTPYYTPSYGAPPDTPSWWVEPRRRR